MTETYFERDEIRPSRRERFQAWALLALILGAAIAVWLALIGATVAGIELGRASDSPPAVGSPAGTVTVGLFLDERGQTCPISSISWPDRLCPESLLP